MTWYDSTTYSRGQERIPTTWKLKGLPGLFITCGHIHNKGQWELTCPPFYHRFELGVSSSEVAAPDAQKYALSLVIGKFEKALVILRKEEL